MPPCRGVVLLNAAGRFEDAGEQAVAAAEVPPLSAWGQLVDSGEGVGRVVVIGWVGRGVGALA